MTKVIHEAELAEINDLGENSSSFVIKPLYYGYGNTLGNSLRRVLLSIIKGAAITAFRLEGTNHEFSAVPGIVEDTVDIILNLKNIHLKSHVDTPIEIHLEKKGAGVVKASDITLPAEVEIANPQQVICTIDDPDFVLKMDMVVDTGRGYLSMEQSSVERVHSDMIAIDAVFTPVLRVRYNAENTRVGQDTNLQQLTLTIDTDGTITPKEAFEEAAAILVNQYKALAGSTVVESAPAPTAKQAEDESGKNTPIEELGLSARTANALLNNDIHNVRELVALSESDLKDLKGFGAKALDEVHEKLTELKV